MSEYPTLFIFESVADCETATGWFAEALPGQSSGYPGSGESLCIRSRDWAIKAENLLKSRGLDYRVFRLTDG